MTDRRRSAEQRAADFHRAHPEVLDAVIGVARDTKAGRGYRAKSINGVLEVLRWAPEYRELRVRLGVKDGEGFTFNNSYRAYYARLAMETAPDLKGFFVTRKLRSE
jgi:hypothetical protein